MRIALLQDQPDWRAHLPAVEEIFFAASRVQQFRDEADRARFKARWLGRYLELFPQSFFVALAPAPETSHRPPPERGRVGVGVEPGFAAQLRRSHDPHPALRADLPLSGGGEEQSTVPTETVIGYLAGCLEDPRGTPLFADLGYYAAFGPLCDAYPAHLHINVAAATRSQGVGAALIEAFAAQCKDAKLPGLHLVTNEGARNVRFYQQNGFKVLATTLSHGTPVVFMGRRLTNQGRAD